MKLEFVKLIIDKHVLCHNTTLTSSCLFDILIIKIKVFLNFSIMKSSISIYGQTVLQNVFNEDEVESEFLLSKPSCFIVIGKPVSLAGEYIFTFYIL